MPMTFRKLAVRILVLAPLVAGGDLRAAGDLERRRGVLQHLAPLRTGCGLARSTRRFSCRALVFISTNHGDLRDWRGVAAVESVSTRVTRAGAFPQLEGAAARRRTESRGATSTDPASRGPSFAPDDVPLAGPMAKTVRRGATGCHWGVSMANRDLPGGKKIYGSSRKPARFVRVHAHAAVGPSETPPTKRKGGVVQGVLVLGLVLVCPARAASLGRSASNDPRGEQSEFVGAKRALLPGSRLSHARAHEKGNVIFLLPT